MSSRRLLITAITLMLIGCIGVGFTLYITAGIQGIPRSLPAPKDKDWQHQLLEALALEKLSLVQYSTDESRYGVMMPYEMIIPQERNHIDWIQALFKAYRLESSVKTPQVENTTSLIDAYQVAARLESNLITRYEHLIQGPIDNESRQVLNTLLSQTQMHYMMFSRMSNGGGMGMMRR